MISAGFDRQKWPKKHEHLVEEAEELHIYEYLHYLQERDGYSGPPHLRPSPRYPEFKLVEGRAGVLRRTLFECPGCGKPRMSLFLLPEDPDIFNYKCRKCHSLVYASQRHSSKHPIRKVLTLRKRRAKEKSAREQKQRNLRERRKARAAAEKKDTRSKAGVPDQKPKSTTDSASTAPQVPSQVEGQLNDLQIKIQAAIPGAEAVIRELGGKKRNLKKTSPPRIHPKGVEEFSPEELRSLIEEIIKFSTPSKKR